VIDVRKIRTLGNLLLKLETRSKNGSNRKLLLLNISYLLPGIFLPMLLFKQNTDHTGFEFSFITFLFYSLILSFTIISELDNIIISKSETELLSSLPIDDNLLVRAKMFMLTRYILFLSLPLLIPGSVFYYFLIKSVPRAIMYIAAGAMLFYFIVYLVILFYSMALRVFRSKNLSTYTLIFQLLMVVLMIAGYQLVSFGVSGKPGSTTSSYIHFLKAKGIIDFMPQAWFALLPAKHNFVPDFALIAKLTLPFLIVYLSYFSLKMYLYDNYAVIREKFQSSLYFYDKSAESKKGFFLSRIISDYIQNIYLRNHLERSSFGLMSAMFKRDKSVRLAIIPMIVIPLGLALFALFTNQLPPPFSRNYFEIKPVFHISILLSVLVVLNTSILGVRITNNRGVSWVYNSYPVESLKNFKNGFRKFFVVYLLIPVCILTGAVMIFKIPADQVFIHTVFIFASANLYNSLFNLFSKNLPFTVENTLVNSLQRMSAIILPFIFGVIIIFLQLFVYKSILSTVIAILAIFTVTFWINYFGFVKHKVKT
jgi:hypothetical protein